VAVVAEAAVAVAAAAAAVTASLSMNVMAADGTLRSGYIASAQILYHNVLKSFSAGTAHSGWQDQQMSSFWQRSVRCWLQQLI